MNRSALFRYVLCALTLLSQSCQLLREGETLPSGQYRVRRAVQHRLPAQPLYVTDSASVLTIYTPDKSTPRQFTTEQAHNLTLYRRHFDIDVFTLPFKVRPARAGVPPQLNSNFNAALYIGRRMDVYHFDTRPVTPYLKTRRLRTQGFGYGLFAGIGSATINEFVTQGRYTAEYEGVIVDVGLALIYDARVFNVGLAVGADHLLDANRRDWIYQQRPWFGVLFGLNLN